MGVTEMNARWRKMQLGDIELMKQDEIAEIYHAIAKNNLSKKEAYLLYLDSRYWKRLRKKVLARDNEACVTCGSVHELHVDHKRYPGFGLELLSDLQTLCRVCHQKKTRYKLIERPRKINVQEQLWRTMRMK
jgi:5-methylcytosine-specific restriction endonuclease McrA